MTATYAPTRARTQRQAQRQASELDGSSHAAIGFVAGIGLGLLTTAAHHGSVATADAIIRDGLFGFLTAGLSLLPDADHPDASFAHAGGPVSHVVSHVISLLFGGHRQGFHSIFGVGVMCAVTASCSLWWPNRWALAGLALLLAICIAAGLRATRFVRHKADAFVVGAAIAGLSVWVVRGDLWWLCALGMALHILEDLKSGHGCALFWPILRRRFGGDGHQPAADRKAQADTPRRASAPRSGTRRPAARKPVTPNRPGTLPVPALASGKRLAWVTVARCTPCVLGSHGDCEDPKCPCTQGRHLIRPGAPRPPRAPDPEEPPF